MSHSESKFSIWFFTGVLLFVYGILITYSAVVHYSAPAPNVVLPELHADLVGGIVILALGGIYLWIYSPRRAK